MLDTSSSGCFITNNTMVTMNTALTAIDRYTPLFLYGVDFTSVLELNGTSTTTNLSGSLTNLPALPRSPSPVTGALCSDFQLLTCSVLVFSLDW